MLVNFSNGSGKIMIYIERPNINCYIYEMSTRVIFTILTKFL